MRAAHSVKGGARLAIGVVAIAALAGCTVPVPTGPTVAAMPASGKSYEQFQSEDASCRQAANYQTNAPAQAQAGTNAAVGSAAVGTVIGAAAGALLGAAAGNAGLGAAAGAGAGLLAGSSVGANGAEYSSTSLQGQYDTVYSQCMFAKGNTVQRVAARPAYGAPYGYYYAPRPYYPYGPSPYYGY